MPRLRYIKSIKISSGELDGDVSTFRRGDGMYIDGANTKEGMEMLTLWVAEGVYEDNIKEVKKLSDGSVYMVYYRFPGK